VKIALVCPYDYLTPGGVVEHITQLGRALADLGHQVTILTPAARPVPPRPGPAVVRLGSVVSVPAYGTVARITLSLRLSGRVKRLLRREQFDIIHLHEPLLPALPLTVLRHSTTVNIGTFHAYWDSDLAYYYMRPLLRRLIRKLHGRIAVSEPARRFVAQHFPGDYTVIPNGIWVSEFAQAEPLPEVCDGWQNVLFVGRLEKRKGLRYLLEAMAQVQAHRPQTRLLVVGDGSPDMRAQVQEWIAALGLQAVRLYGWVPRETLVRLYASCDVFCAPATFGESFGIVLLEAMAAGKPIVASDIEGYRWVMADGVEGRLVPPGDSGALAAALLNILTDPARAARYGMAGRRTAERYDWSRIAREILAYYEMVRQAPPEVPPFERRLWSQVARLGRRLRLVMGAGWSAASGPV
jgi:phosphatidylinositol alpha-mannosyltransferase